MLFADTMVEREESQERSRQKLQCTKNDPAGAGTEQRNPPRLLRGAPVARKETQKIDLLADLRHQRENHGGRSAEQQKVEMAGRVAVFAGEFSPLRKGMRIGISDRREGNDVQNDPQRLRPELEAADQRDAVGHQWNDDDGADQIPDRSRNTEAHLERAGEDDGFDGKEDKSKGRVDQRGDRRTDISEAGTARQEVDVDAAFCGM